MREYKSNLWVIGKNILYGLAAGFVATLVLSWFINSFLATAIGILACLAVIYLAVVSNNITIRLDDETVAFFRFGKQLYSFNLEECSFNAKVVTTNGSGINDSDCDLTVTDKNGNITQIDCSMLGRSRFMEFLEDLGVFDGEPVAVPTRRNF